MAENPTSGATPGETTAEKSDVQKTEVQVPAKAEPSSLPATNQTEIAFTERVKQAKSTTEIRALLEEAKRPAPEKPPEEAAKPSEVEKPAEAETTAETPPATEEGETPAPEAETTPESTEATPETKPEEVEDTDDEAVADEGPVKPITSNKVHLRVKDDDEVGRLALAFKKRNRDWTLEQAMEAARDQLGVKTPEKTAATEPAKPKSDLPQTVEATDAAIKELRAARRKANAELKFEEASDFGDKVEDMILHRSNLERQIERQEVEATRTYSAKFTQSEAKAIDMYDFAAKPDSPGGKRMKEIDSDLEATGNPLFNDPNKPLKVAMMVANELNIAPRKKGAPAAPAKPATPSAPPQAKKQVLPSGNSRTTVPNPNQPPADVAKYQAIKTMSDLRKVRQELGLPI